LSQTPQALLKPARFVVLTLAASCLSAGYGGASQAQRQQGPCCSSRAIGAVERRGTTRTLHADLEGNGRSEAVLFEYVPPSEAPAAMRRRCESLGGQKPVPQIAISSDSPPSDRWTWREPICDGGWLFGAGTGIYSVGDTVPHLIAFSYLGPSYGENLYAWRWRGGGMRPVHLLPRLSHGVSPLSTTWTPRAGHTVLVIASVNKDDPRPPHLLEWVRSEYVDTSSRHPEYYRTHFAVSIPDLLGRRLPPDGWAHVADFNVRLLLLQCRVRDAARLCKGILAALADPSRTPPPARAPNLQPAVASNITKEFDREVSLAKSQVDQLLDRCRRARSARLRVARKSMPDGCGPPFSRR
jgi:hypothetical protein